jgi:hypothetical protein
MPAARAARYLTLAGLAAGAAAAAHGGWGELSDPRWAAAAALGACLAAAGLAWTGIAAGAARWAASELEHGRARTVGRTDHRPLTVLEAAAVLISAQASAHAALLVAGAPAHPGAGGALALHVALALAAALAASTADRMLSRALTRLESAVGILLELLSSVSVPRPPLRSSVPRTAPSARLPLGRAPPLAA